MKNRRGGHKVYIVEIKTIGSRGPIVAFLGFHRKYFFRHLGRDKLAQASINTSKLSSPDKKLHQREQKAYMQSL